MKNDHPIQEQTPASLAPNGRPLVRIRHEPTAHGGPWIASVRHDQSTCSAARGSVVHAMLCGLANTHAPLDPLSARILRMLDRVDRVRAPLRVKQNDLRDHLTVGQEGLAWWLAAATDVEVLDYLITDEFAGHGPEARRMVLDEALVRDLIDQVEYDKRTEDHA